MSNPSISPERRTAFRAGNVLSGIGFALFGSFFIAVAMGVSGHDGIESYMPVVIAATLIGFALVVIGGLLRRTGQAGLAGSGLTLDPDGARRDLEPWSRMAGGMLSDTLDEAGINLNQSKNTPGDLSFDEQIRRLASLKNDGLISDVEFVASRQKILDSIGK